MNSWGAAWRYGADSSAHIPRAQKQLQDWMKKWEQDDRWTQQRFHVLSFSSLHISVKINPSLCVWARLPHTKRWICFGFDFGFGLDFVFVLFYQNSKSLCCK